jgi:hypothetical protein
MKQILALGLLGFVLCAAPVFCETPEPEPPEDGLVINSIKGRSERDLGVTFNHSSHADYTCIDCHHATKEDELPQSCGAGKRCHDKTGIDELRGFKSYFRTMHKKDRRHPTCVGCHTELFEGDKYMTSCTRSACHPDGLY